MKLLLSLLIMLFSTAAIANANCCVLANSKDRCLQDFQSTITDIRAEYKNVNDNQRNYRVVKKTLDNYDAGDAKAQLFYQDTDLRKMVVRVYGEAGYTVSKYYFNYGQLFFLFSVVYQYDQSTYFYGKPKVTNKIERRYYFKDGRLIRWLGDKNRPAACTASNYFDRQVLINSELIQILSQ